MTLWHLPEKSTPQSTPEFRHEQKETAMKNIPDIKARISASLDDLRESIPELEIHENEPMCTHCSFKAGGPVRAFIVPQSTAVLTDVCKILKRHRLAPYVLGNGTNVVFPDEGEDLLTVISTQKLQNIYLTPEGEIYSEAGVPLSKLAAFALDNSLTGLEFASGIPGSVGGGIIMNAGAYDGELKDAVRSVGSYCLSEQRFYEFDNSQCSFGYRKSFFQSAGSHIVTSAVFHLEKGNRDEIAAEMRELNARRRDKQPLDLPSAGSAFRRPEGYFAAALIEQAGLKGYSVGGAQVSEKHAGFIVNTGRATSNDLQCLIDCVISRVHENTGVDLQPEIILLPPQIAIAEDGQRMEA